MSWWRSHQVVCGFESGSSILKSGAKPGKRPSKRSGKGPSALFMRIKKKAPKPSAKRPPLYLLGYRGTRPMSEELALWYDQAYGGPLRIVHEDRGPDSWQVTHVPWSAHVVIPLPSTHTIGLVDQLAWEHDKIGAVAPAVVPPREMPDT